MGGIKSWLVDGWDGWLVALFFAFALASLELCVVL